MLTKTEIDNLTRDEQKLLKTVRSVYGQSRQIIETITEGILYIQLPSAETENHIEIFFDESDIVLSIGKWTHSHPSSMEELISDIDRITNGKIVVWKVTRPDGYWYSGHYDVDMYRENINMVDEPDTNIENGDRIERSTFHKVIEDRIIN